MREVDLVIEEDNRFYPLRDLDLQSFHCLDLSLASAVGKQTPPEINCWAFDGRSSNYVQLEHTQPIIHRAFDGMALLWRTVEPMCGTSKQLG